MVTEKTAVVMPDGEVSAGNDNAQPARQMKTTNYNYTLMITIILLLAGLVCFALFYKSVDYFENI